MEGKKIYKINRTSPTFTKEVNDFLHWCMANGYRLQSNKEYFYAEPLFTTEKEKQAHLRKLRKGLLDAFDKWEKAVLRSRELDDERVMQWYVDLLDLKESAFNNIPERIAYYL